MSNTVQYLTNENGKQTGVVLSVADYEKMLEDLGDLAVIAERREEETIPHDEFKKQVEVQRVRHRKDVYRKL